MLASFIHKLAEVPKRLICYHNLYYFILPQQISRITKIILRILSPQEFRYFGIVSAFDLATDIPIDL